MPSGTPELTLGSRPRTLRFASRCPQVPHLHKQYVTNGPCSPPRPLEELGHKGHRTAEHTWNLQDARNDWPDLGAAVRSGHLSSGDPLPLKHPQSPLPKLVTSVWS